MKRKILACALALAAAVSALELATPENQQNWRFPGESLNIGADGIAIPFDGVKQQVVVGGLDVAQGEKGLIALAYRLTKGSKLFFYVENHTPPNWQNKALNLTGTDSWKVALLRFQFDKPVKGKSYVGLRLTGQGVLEVKSLSFIKGVDMDSQFFNSDFAQGEVGWVMEENATVVESKSGGRCLELWAKEIGTRARALSAAVPVKPLQHYRLSFKATALAGFGKKSIEHDLRMYPMDKRGDPLTGSDKWLTALDGRTQDKHVEFQVPARHSEITFALEARGPARVQLTGFSLEEITPAVRVAEIQLDMPFNYHDGVFATNPASQMTGKVAVFDSSAAVAELSLTDGDKVLQETKLAGTGGPFTVPAPAPGKSFTLALTVKSANGDILHRETKQLHNYPPNPVEVTFNDEGTTLVNGQPFFHIGNWWFTKRGDRDEDIEFLKEAGFNVIFLPNDHPDRFPLLDLCQRHGVFGIVELPHSYPGDCQSHQAREAFKDKWIGLIRKYQGHPALFGYFGPDEAMLAGYQIDTLEHFYHWARDNDPYHPLWFNEAPCGLVSELTSYAKNTCDVFGVDIYPIGAKHGSDLGDRSMTVVGLHTDRCIQAVEARKPVWMILQGFSWIHMRKPARFQPASEVPDALYPTYEQTRFMTFESILHGATGIQFHYLGYTVNLPDDFWRGIRRTTLELKYLTPVLTARTSREAPMKCASPKVRMMVKSLKGVNYYILANESPDTVLAHFTGFPENQLKAIFQDEPVAVRDGCFDLILEPYAVRVMSGADFAPASVIWQADTYRPYSARLKDDTRKN